MADRCSVQVHKRPRRSFSGLHRNDCGSIAGRCEAPLSIRWTAISAAASSPPFPPQQGRMRRALLCAELRDRTLRQRGRRCVGSKGAGVIRRHLRLRVNPLVAEAATDSGGSILERVIPFAIDSLGERRVLRRPTAAPRGQVASCRGASRRPGRGAFGRQGNHAAENRQKIEIDRRSAWSSAQGLGRQAEFEATLTFGRAAQSGTWVGCVPRTQPVQRSDSRTVCPASGKAASPARFDLPSWSVEESRERLSRRRGKASPWSSPRRSRHFLGPSVTADQRRA
jgi:hypothetical protein